ncbi:MAG: Na+/H+ antiporter subunit E [Chromatiaceae bacterium]
MPSPSLSTPLVYLAAVGDSLFAPFGPNRLMVPLYFILLTLWLMLNASLAPDVLLLGVVAALVIAGLFRSRLSPLTEFRATPAALGAAPLYLLYFLKELVRSNLRLATVVLSPGLPMSPGIVKVRTRLKSRMGRLLLASSITLTPGTLTVELQDEWLYVHWVQMDHDDIEGATASIVAGFERYLEVMYG